MIVSPNHVVLGADSLLRGDSTNRYGCKIMQSGAVFWAAAGLEDDSKTGFGVRKFIDQSAAKTSHVQDMLDSAGVRLLPSLQKEIPLIKRGMPWFYQRILNGGFILQIMAARETGVGLEAYVKEFRVVNDKVGTAPSRTCSQLQGCIFHAGANDAVSQYIASHDHEVWDAKADMAIDRMMAVAFQADPANIGGPISILDISPNNTGWLRKNGCADIRSEKGRTQNQTKRAH